MEYKIKIGNSIIHSSANCAVLALGCPAYAGSTKVRDALSGVSETALVNGAREALQYLRVVVDRAGIREQIDIKALGCRLRNPELIRLVMID